MFDEGSSDPLFNVFSGKAMDDQFDDFDDSETEVTSTMDNHKRARSSSPLADDASEETEIKRLRAEEATHAQPIVADSFEEESSRQVTNVAGLQGSLASEETELVLNHQVWRARFFCNG